MELTNSTDLHNSVVYAKYREAKIHGDNPKLAVYRNKQLYIYDKNTHSLKEKIAQAFKMCISQLLFAIGTLKRNTPKVKELKQNAKNLLVNTAKQHLENQVEKLEQKKVELQTFEEELEPKRQELRRLQEEIQQLQARRNNLSGYDLDANRKNAFNEGFMYGKLSNSH